MDKMKEKVKLLVINAVRISMHKDLKDMAYDKDLKVSGLVRGILRKEINKWKEEKRLKDGE